jgi:hypothetical protein
VTIADVPTRGAVTIYGDAWAYLRVAALAALAAWAGKNPV